MEERNNLESTQRNPNIIVKNGVYLLARYILVMLIAFYTTRLTLQVLGDEDYGINNIIGGLISMFAVVSMPITSALQRYFNVEFTKKEISPDIVFNTSLRIIGAIIVVMLILYETIGLYFVKEILNYPPERGHAVIMIFHITALLTLISFAIVPFTALLFAKEDMGIPAAVELGGSIYKLVFLWLIPYVPSDSLILYTLFLLSLYIIQFLFYIIYCNKKYPESRLKRSTDKSLGKNILKFAGWNSVEAVAGLSITYLSNIIINYFGGVLYNTAYGLAKSLNTAVSSLTTNLVKAVEPQITSSTVIEDDHYRNSLVLTTIKMASIGVGFILVFFFFSGERFLQLWLGRVPKYAYEFCFIMLFSSLFSSVILPLRSVIIATGKIQKYFTAYGAISVIVLLLMFVLLKMGMPVVTAAILVAACNGLFFVTAIVTTVRVSSLRISDIFSTILLSVVALGAAFLVYGGCLKMVPQGGVVISIVTLLASFIILIVTTYFVSLNHSEKAMIKSIVDKIKNKIHG